MKPILYTLFMLIMLTACRKENDIPIVKVQNKIPTYSWRIKEHWINESICRKYIYTANNRLLQIKISENEVDLETISYTYSGNKATVKSNKNNYQYTYFLNTRGLADSCEVILPGYAFIKRVFFYASDNKLIRKLETGTIVSVPFIQKTDYFYDGSNLILEKITEEEEETSIAYQFDETIINKLQGTEFLETFLPAQPKMLTKVIFGEEEENTYNYEIESDSVIIRNDFLNNGTNSTNIYYLEFVK